MTTLGQLVTSHSELAEELPLIHTSRAECLMPLARSHALSPTPCRVFHESVLYLFYGRPAYRSSKGARPGEPIALCPVCFVFKPYTVSKMSPRLFPCDTGALHSDRFAPILTAADLAELELDPRIESARRLVPMFFSSNRDYFFGKAVNGLALTAGSVPYRYHQLLVAKGAAPFDDRKSAIEVQIRESVSLRDTLSFVVLPRDFLDHAPLRQAILEEWNCDPIGYDTVDGSAPAEYYGVVRREVEKRLMQASRI